MGRDQSFVLSGTAKKVADFQCNVAMVDKCNAAQTAVPGSLQPVPAFRSADGQRPAAYYKESPRTADEHLTTLKKRRGLPHTEPPVAWESRYMALDHPSPSSHRLRGETARLPLARELTRSSVSPGRDGGARAPLARLPG
ncbi:unnamed protein product [Pleuronectes platessa]|uniref:Uncharacterized protein n=1 Tax=Pleuronectes platessa TaxID=8262 RepID=A0A9N7YHL6_PLEPL|nr:unnamed protein product [Pleuronectes platessa]